MLGWKLELQGVDALRVLADVLFRRMFDFRLSAVIELRSLWREKPNIWLQIKFAMRYLWLAGVTK